MQHHYLADEVYHRLVEALAKLELSAWNGDELDHDQIMETLGEVAGIWAASIADQLSVDI
jgi:hypothetical protein